MRSLSLLAVGRRRGTTKFAAGFDEVFISSGIRTIRTPIRAPRANAFAERFVGTVRRKCVDRTITVGRRHLEATVREYVEHYNGHRPHRSLGQLPPAPNDMAPTKSKMSTLHESRARIGSEDLIHEIAWSRDTDDVLAPAGFSAPTWSVATSPVVWRHYSEIRMPPTRACDLPVRSRVGR